MTNLSAIARALGGEVHGLQVLAPGFGHSRRDRSLAIRLDPRAPGGLLVHSFAGDDALVAKDHVRAVLGLRSGTLPPFSKAPQAEPPPDDAERTARAVALWREARDPRGTVVDAYLRRRGLNLPDEAAGEAIRFHPACPFAGEHTPAMVCLVRDVVTDQPKAIHRTSLSPDGLKVEVRGADRLSLGPIAAGAIKLTPDADVTTCLGIAEGVETALSMRRVPEFGASPVWSLISEAGVRRFPVLSGIECLWVAVDHDPAGIKAARTVADHWQAAGAEAFLITPSAPRADLNDIFGVRHA
jgi:putative DNA primase/helicase